jgi:hypothetical protein
LANILLSLRSQWFCAYWRKKCYLWKNAQRDQKSGTVEEYGLSRPACGRGMELSDRNGLVPHEDERYGRHEVRRAAETARMRKLEAAQDDNDHEAGECAVFLALAAARPRMPGASK